MPASKHKSSDKPQKLRGFMIPLWTTAFVLYLLALSLMAALYIYKVNSHTKEKIAFFIEMKDTASEAEIFAFQQKLSAAVYTKEASVRFIAREEALDIMTLDATLKKEDLLLFGENLLPDIIQFNISDAYIYQFDSILNTVQSEAVVQEVFFGDNSVSWMQSDPGQIFVACGIIVSLLMLFLVILFRNTFKMRLLADKKAIESMQKKELAFEWLFNPYKNNIFVGTFIATTVSVLLLAATVVVFNTYYMSNSIGFRYYMWTSIVSFAIFVIGNLLAWTGYFFTVRGLLKKPVRKWNL